MPALAAIGLATDPAAKSSLVHSSSGRYSRRRLVGQFVVDVPHSVIRYERPGPTEWPDVKPEVRAVNLTDNAGRTLGTVNAAATGG